MSKRFFILSHTYDRVCRAFLYLECEDDHETKRDLPGIPGSRIRRVVAKMKKKAGVGGLITQTWDLFSLFYY